MFLVSSQKLPGTIECFAASGNRFPANEKGLRRCRSPLLEGLSLMCADPVFVVGVAAPRNGSFELSSPVMGSSRTKTARAAECSCFSRYTSAVLPIRQPRARPPCRFFPIDRTERGTNIASAHYVGGWCQPSSTHCPGARPCRSVGRTGCILEQPVRPLTGQFIPISTAIRIRSEWFLAPSFCLSRDVVLATVL